MVAHMIQSKEPSLGVIMRNGGEDLVRVHVMEAIATYVSMLHASRAIGVDAIVAIVQQFMQHPDVKQLRPSELKTFFALAFTQQRYGKLYGGFGYDTLLEWFNTFYNERIDCIVEYRENEHQRATMWEKQSRYRSDGDAFGVGEIMQQQNKEQSNEQDTQSGDADAHD